MQNQNNHHVPLVASILFVLVGFGLMAQMAVTGAFAFTLPPVPPVITSPASGEFVGMGMPATVTTRFGSTDFGQGSNQVFIRYQIIRIPQPGQTIDQAVHYIGDTAPFTVTSGDNNYNWTRAGFYIGSTTPWLGDTRLTAHLMTSEATPVELGNWTSQIFQIGKRMDIISPPSDTTFYWGQKNQTVTVDYLGDATQLKGTLLAGGTANQPQDTPILFTNCVPNPVGNTTCTFDFPDKTGNLLDGIHWIAIDEIGSQFGTPIHAVVRVNMASATQDFSFDTAKGVKGFEFSPMVFDPTDPKDINVKVWVRYEDTDGKPSPKSTLNMSAGFTVDQKPEKSDVDVNLPDGYFAAGESKLVNLGTFKGDSNIWFFKLIVDSKNEVHELDETNNDYAGDGTTGRPTLDLGVYGATLYLGAGDNPANNHIDVQAGDYAPMIARILATPNDPGQPLPEGEKILSGSVEFSYDAAGMSITSADITSDIPGFTVSYNNQLSSSGKLVVNFLVDSVDYPRNLVFKVNWKTILPGEYHPTVTWTGLGDTTDNTNLFLTADNTPGAYGDVLRNFMPGMDFTIQAQGIVKPVSGTYFSQKFAVPKTGERFVGWDKFRAIYNDQLSTQGLTTDTKFSLGFFNAAGQNLCNGTSCAPGFDADGFYLVPVEKSYEAGGGNTGEVDMTNLNSITWMSQVKFVQYRVAMSTSNYYGPADAQPWVQSVALDYSADQLGEVGLVNSDNAVVNVPRGGTANYTFQIIRSDTTFNGTVNWTITAGQTGNTDVTISPSQSPTELPLDDAHTLITVSVVVTATQAAQLNIHYPFTISGTTTDNQKTIRALPINVDVTGNNAAPYTLSIVPAAGSVAKGGTIGFDVTAIRQPGFTAAIQLSDNITTIFGADVTSVSYNPATKLIAANSNGPVTITLVASNTIPNLPETKTFTISGTSGSDNSGVSASLTISDGTDLKNISLELTVPIEGGTDATQPVFTFRLYNAANAQVFTKADIHTTANKATVAIPNLTVGGIYRGFVRSTRHLWRAGDGTITITSGATQNYTMSFTKLLAGDIDPNNIVNALDVPVLTHDWGKTGAGLLPDFNSDGSVNALDIVAIVTNWFKTGATLPGN